MNWLTFPVSVFTNSMYADPGGISYSVYNCYYCMLYVVHDNQTSSNIASLISLKPRFNKNLLKKTTLGKVLPTFLLSRHRTMLKKICWYPQWLGRQTDYTVSWSETLTLSVKYYLFGATGHLLFSILRDSKKYSVPITQEDI